MLPGTILGLLYVLAGILGFFILLGIITGIIIIFQRCYNNFYNTEDTQEPLLTF